MLGLGTKLRMAGIDYQVKIAGPGSRTEIFLQGCLQNCKDCFNPETHALDGGRLMPVRYLIKDIREHTPQRMLTISGGEPLLQARGLRKLIKPLIRDDFHILMYTGISYDELMMFMLHKSGIPKLLDIGQNVTRYRNDVIDVLSMIHVFVEGPFDVEKRQPITEGSYVGSSNQRIIPINSDYLVERS